MTQFPHRTLSQSTGAMLRRARKAKGWTLEQAAQEVGCHFSHLSHLERATRAPSRALALDLIYAYDLKGELGHALMAESIPAVGKDKPSRRKAKAAA